MPYTFANSFELLNLVVHFMTHCALVVNRENEKGIPDPKIGEPFYPSGLGNGSARGRLVLVVLPDPACPVK